MLNAIDVMDNLSFFKVSANFILHYKTMLFNIKVWLHRVWMISLKNIDVPFLVNKFTSFPEVRILTNIFIKSGTWFRAINNFLVAGNKSAFTFFTKFFVINLRPSVFKFSMPDSVFGVCPIRTFNYFRNFHNCTVEQFIGNVNGL